AKCRVESNKPGIWKAAFVEFDGAEGQTGHPQKIEKTPLTKPVIQAKKVAEESEGLSTIEDVAAESLEQIAATPTLSDDPAPETIASPTKPIRRRRSAKAIGGMSEL